MPAAQAARFGLRIRRMFGGASPCVRRVTVREMAADRAALGSTRTSELMEAARMNRLMVRMMTLGAVATLAVPLALMQPAGAATAPNLACGDTQPGPCQETAHFSDINDMNSPAPPGGGCPAYLSTDFFTFVGTGNGVDHINVNKAQDGWFTTTFTGTVTITAYLHGTVGN